MAFKKITIVGVVAAVAIIASVITVFAIGKVSGAQTSQTTISSDSSSSLPATMSSDANNSSSQSVASAVSTISDDKSSSGNNTSSEQNISEKVIDYIINGQGDIPSANKLNWSQTFLKQVDIESLYKQYTTGGGNADDIKNFAVYLTQNAPILSNWKDLFKNDLYNAYGEKVSKLEPLHENLYQAYIIKDGSEVPYVVVSSKTGYFHG